MIFARAACPRQAGRTLDGLKRGARRGVVRLALASVSLVALGGCITPSYKAEVNRLAYRLPAERAPSPAIAAAFDLGPDREIPTQVIAMEIPRDLSGE